MKKALANFALTWRDRVRTLRSQSLETQDRKEAARLSLQVAKLFARFDPAARGKVDEALDRAFLLYPGMPEAAAFVESLYSQDAGERTRAAARLEELAARTQEKSAKAELWIRAGTQRLSRLSDPQRALEDFRLAHLADPARADAASLAVELAMELGNPAAAAELLEAHLAAQGDPAQAVSVRKQLAALYAGPLKTPARARAHLEAAVSAAPGELALAFQATQLAAEAGDAQALARLLPLLDLPGPYKAATELLERCAQVFEGTNDPDRAADALARALLHAPSRVELLPRLLEDGKRSAPQSLGPLAASLRRAAGLAPEPVAAAAVWRALAELLQLAPDRAVEAQAAWREVALRDPTAAQPAAPAPPTAAQLQAQLAALGDGPRPQDALPLWRQLFALSPGDAGLARQLAGVLAALERWEELAEVTARLAEIAPTPEARLDYCVRLARLYADSLGKPEQAAAVLLARAAAGELGAGVVEELERLAARGVKREEIQAALTPHYQRSGAHQKEVAELLHALGTAKKPGKQKKALLQLAELHEGTLADAPAALGYLLRAVAVAPTDAPLGERAWQLASKLHRLAELGRSLADAAAQQSERAGKAALTPVRRTRRWRARSWRRPPAGWRPRSRPRRRRGRSTSGCSSTWSWRGPRRPSATCAGGCCSRRGRRSAASTSSWRT